MAAPKVVDVGRLVDEQPIRAFHIKLVLLLFCVLISDGFDLQAIGYAAPGLVKVRSQACLPGTVSPNDNGRRAGLERQCELPSTMSGDLNVVALSHSSPSQLHPLKLSLRDPAIVADVHLRRARISMPGERSEETRARRGRDGIPLAPALQRGLDQLADELGIAKLS